MTSILKFNFYWGNEHIHSHAKIVLLGKPATGKTALLSRLVTNEYMGDYFPTLGIDLAQKEFSDQMIYAHFFDFGGVSTDLLLKSNFLTESNMILLVSNEFTVEEFDWMENLIYNIKASNPHKVDFLFIRNKIDLNQPTPEEISLCQTFTSKYSMSGIFVSAKTGENFEFLQKNVLGTLEENAEKLCVAGAYFDCEIQGLY